MKISHDRHRDPESLESIDDSGKRGRGLIVVDGDPDQLAPRLRQRRHLGDGGRHIGGIGVGHRLDHHGMRGADGDGADEDGGGGAAGHTGNLPNYVNGER